MKKLIYTIAAFGLLIFPQLAQAQSQRNPCFYTSENPGPGNGCIPVSSATPFPVAATVNASIAPFTPAASGARGTPLTVSTVDVSGTLPTNSGAVVVSNPGATLAYCNVNGIAATTSDYPIAPGGGGVGFGVPTGVTTLHCISTGAGTTINSVGGTGLAALTGGGGSGGGGGGVVTQPTASLLNATIIGTGTLAVQVTSAPTTAVTGTFFQATQPVSATALPLPAGASTSANQSTEITSLGTIATNSGTQATAANQTTGNTSAAITATNTTAISSASGTTADTACTTDNGTCTLEALIKRNNQNLTTLNTTAAAPANLAVNVTPTDCSGTVATGGTAVNAFTAQTTLHGFTILNDDTTEPLWISFTTTAAASTAGSFPLAPATASSFAGASSFTSPPGFGTNHALSVVATTSAHKFSCTWW